MTPAEHAEALRQAYLDGIARGRLEGRLEGFNAAIASGHPKPLAREGRPASASVQAGSSARQMKDIIARLCDELIVAAATTHGVLLRGRFVGIALERELAQRGYRLEHDHGGLWFATKATPLAKEQR